MISYLGGDCMKTEVIKFSDFMDGSYKKTNKQASKTVYSISPFVMVDPTILLIGLGILSFVALEKYFEYVGNYAGAERVHTAFNIAIPTIAFGFIWKLMITASGAFL